MLRSNANALIEAIEQVGVKLYDEEAAFLNTMKGSIRPLTLKQGLWLQKIYARVTGGGRYQPREYFKGR